MAHLCKDVDYLQFKKKKKYRFFFTAIQETQLSLENKAVLFLLPGLGLGLHF